MIFNCKDLDGVIFDLDGTLVESSHVWERVDREFLSKRGLDVPQDYTEKIACLNFYEGAMYTISRFGLNESAEAIIAEWHSTAIHEYESSVFLKDGARNFILSLKANGMKIGLATASSPELYTAAFKAGEIYDCFDAFCTSEEVCRSKEYPDVYIYAAGKLGCRVDRCAVIEDVERCAHAAKSAGFCTYLIGKDFTDFREAEIVK